VRHHVTLTMTAVGVALLSAACGSGSPDASNKVIQRQTVPDSQFKPAALEATIDDLVTAIEKTPAESHKMAILLKQLTGFFASVATGSNRAISELQVTGTVVGPASPTGDQTQNIMLQDMFLQQALTEGYDTLGISPQATSLDSDIDAYVAKGVPVVALDSDAPDSMRSLYVGTINKAAGVTGGNTLLGMLPPAPGTVIVLGNTDTTWADGIDRTAGAQGVLEAAGYTVQVISTDWSMTGEASNVTALQAALTGASPPAVGMLGLFSAGYRCAMAAQANGMTGADIKIVGFDFDPSTVMFLQSGLMQATHAQREYYEGYLVPYVLYGIKVLGLDATKAILKPQMVDDFRVDTGVDVVPAAQVDDYNAFLDSIGANTQ